MDFVCHFHKYLARESHILLGFATTKGVLEPLKEPSIWPPTNLDVAVFDLGIKASLKCCLVRVEKVLTYIACCPPPLLINQSIDLFLVAFGIYLFVVAFGTIHFDANSWPSSDRFIKIRSILIQYQRYFQNNANYVEWISS